MTRLNDLDHVLMASGKIYRVLGNIDSQEVFLGYNVYSPDENGDRLYEGKRYIKNFIEDQKLPDDVFQTYEILHTKDVVRRYDPIQSAKQNNISFRNSVWFELYEELKHVFGEDAVGIFGSSMFNLHLTPDGKVRKDVDFVIQGLKNVEVLRQRLPAIRNALGFTEVSRERQLTQYERYQKVFRNENNSIEAIIKRRWTGLQLSENVVSTIRFRDPSITIPLELVSPVPDGEKNAIVTGKVSDADLSNLFPRMFTLETDSGKQPVYLFWWKFSTPVNNGDTITLCGDKMTVQGQTVVRISNFKNHWLRISEA